jgi:S-adenosylmethionine hydrolase
LLQSEKYFFVGPDNGLFSLVVKESEPQRVVELTEKKFWLNPLGHTFHGRDIFAPVAAYLSLGIAPEEFGPELKEYETISLPLPRMTPDQVEGHIIHVDHFGNLETNIHRQTFDEFADGEKVKIKCGLETLYSVSSAYDEVGEGSPVAIFGSSGFLEVSVNRGSAQQKLRLVSGDKIYVVRIEGNDQETG